MPKSKKSLVDTADTVRPYVERAMTDEKLRREVLRAFSTARELYGDLLTDRESPMTMASRVATDDEVRDKLREAIDDLRSASERLKGRRERSSNRASTLLIVGIALGILFNPVTGAETRRFIRDMMSSGEDSHEGHDHGSNGRP
jgi:gas vesicle protein